MSRMSVSTAGRATHTLHAVPSPRPAPVQQRRSVTARATAERRSVLLGLGLTAVVGQQLAKQTPPARAEAAAAAAKTTGRTVREVGQVIASDFQERQYYITGQLTPGIYEDDCVFIDPTTTVTGWKPYTAAVAQLFNAKASHADLISIKAVDVHHIFLRWRLQGTLAIGGLQIKPYTGSTTYTLNERGLVSRHEETWDISVVDAFASTLFPSFGAPPAPAAGPPVMDL